MISLSLPTTVTTTPLKSTNSDIFFLHLPSRSFSTDSVPTAGRSPRISRYIGALHSAGTTTETALSSGIFLREPPLYLGGGGDSCNKIAIHENEDVVQVLGPPYPFAVASWRMSSFCR